MSFQTNIAGIPPCNSFTFTTTSVSANSVSCDNLSATNASIVNLTTTTFSPVNINTSNIIADTISASSISATTINSSLLTTVDLIATSGTINTFFSGFIESVGANISDLTVEDITVNNRLLIPDQTNVGLASYMERDANILKLAGSLLASDADPNIEFYTNEGTGNPKLKIPAGSDIVELRELNVVGTAEANQVNCDDLNSAYIINLSTITTDRVLAQTLKGNISENLIAGVGINLSTVSGITTITNTGIVTDPLTIGTINVSNLSADHIHVSNISLDGIIGGSTANIAVGNIPTINSSTVNASTVDTDLLYIDDSNTGDTSSLARANNIITLTGTTLNSSVDMNFFLSNPGTRFPIMSLNGNLDSVDINGDLRVTGTIDGDISPNLAAGTGISLSTTGGITTIGNTAQTSDPLNLSVLNASTINSSNITNSSSITTGSLTGDISSNLASAAGITLSTVNGLTTISSNALSQSTQYAFQASSNLNNNQTVGAGTLLYFNVIELETTPVFGAGYDTGGQRYYIPAGAGGVWTFGFKAFINTTPTSFRIGIYKNGGLIGMGGYSSDTTESFDVVCQANPGEYIWVMGVSGGASVYMAATHSWFYGYRLEAVNNSVGITTDLTVADLNATDVGAVLVAATDVIAGTATAGITNTSTLNASTVNGDISNNLAAGTNIALNTTGGITTISTITPGLSHPLNISNLNVSVDANISNLNVQTQMTATNASFTNISASGTITANVLGATDVVSTTSYAGFMNTSILSASVVSAGSDISGTISAGANITLTTDPTSKITTIAAAPGLTDPLNISTINVSVAANISTATISTLTVQTQLTAGNSSFTNISASGDMNVSRVFAFGMNSDFNTTNIKQFYTNQNGAAFTPAIVSKDTDILSIDAGIASTPGITRFSTDGVTYNMNYDGDLNVSTINNSVINSSLVNIYNASVEQTLEFSAGSTLKMDNSTGDSVFLYNDSTRFNYGTLAGNTANINFGSGYNASTIQITGGNVINMENTAGVNISNVSINNASITTAEIVNLSSPLVGASRFYSRRQTFEQTPGNTNTDYYQNYDTLAISNPYVSWATPNLATGGANTGFLIQTAGTYRIEFTFNAHSLSYNNRVNWFAKLFKNGAVFDGNQYAIFTYTRGDNTSFSQWSTANTFCIVPLAVNDYIHTVTTVAKNSPIHNNTWDGLRAAWGATCSFEFLG